MRVCRRRSSRSACRRCAAERASLDASHLGRRVVAVDAEEPLEYFIAEFFRYFFACVAYFEIYAFFAILKMYFNFAVIMRIIYSVFYDIFKQAVEHSIFARYDNFIIFIKIFC